MRSLLILLLMAGFAHASEAGKLHPERLENLVKQDCGACHGMTRKGGLGPDIRAQTLAGRDPAILADTIRNGIPQTAMPPWGPLLSDAEIDWIAQYLLKEPTK
jgi:cytochrome c55X